MARMFFMKEVFVMLLCIFCNSEKVNAQLSIKGPSCVIPGVTYQYIISGVSPSDQATQLCIRGGALLNSDTCISGAGMGAVLLTWKDASFHQLELTSISGSVILSVNATTELKGGQIEESNRVQVYDSTKATYTFSCTPASGGSCQSDFIYQWQKSENGVNWENVPGAMEKNFSFSGIIKVNTYFRRVTLETTSQSVAYSEHGLLFIDFGNE